jgi:hypothetical protein
VGSANKIMSTFEGDNASNQEPIPSTKNEKNLIQIKCDEEKLKSFQFRQNARCKLLGNQWFMGRTGFDNLKKSDEGKAEAELN